MSALPSYDTSVQHVSNPWSQRPEEGGTSPVTGVADGCKLPRGCWDLNSSPHGSAVSALNCGAVSPARGSFIPITNKQDFRFVTKLRGQVTVHMYLISNCDHSHREKRNNMSSS